MGWIRDIQDLQASVFDDGIRIAIPALHTDDPLCCVIGANLSRGRRIRDVDHPQTVRAGNVCDVTPHSDVEHIRGYIVPSNLKRRRWIRDIYCVHTSLAPGVTCTGIVALAQVWCSTRDVNIGLAGSRGPDVHGDVVRAIIHVQESGLAGRLGIGNIDDVQVSIDHVGIVSAHDNVLDQARQHHIACSDRLLGDRDVQHCQFWADPGIDIVPLGDDGRDHPADMTDQLDVPGVGCRSWGGRREWS
jgi:hypothetical protein